MVIWGLFLEMWFFKVWTQNVIFSIGGNLPKSGKSPRSISSSCSKISKSFFQKLIGSICRCRLNLNICKKISSCLLRIFVKILLWKNFWFFSGGKSFLWKSLLLKKNEPISLTTDFTQKDKFFFDFQIWCHSREMDAGRVVVKWKLPNLSQFPRYVSFSSYLLYPSSFGGPRRKKLFEFSFSQVFVKWKRKIKLIHWSNLHGHSIDISPEKVLQRLS